jgi:hypothetical protein
LQKGNEIFADSFADNTGGWSADPDASFGKGLSMRLYAPNASWVYLNNTFNATEGDYCVEGTVPTSPAANNFAYIGLVFLAKDYNNFFLLEVGSTGGIYFWRKVSGNWTQIGNLSRPSLAPKPGDVVTLRAVVKGSLVTVSLNGVDLQKVRVQVPSGLLQFGVFVQTDHNDVPKPGVTFQFSKYRVTAGE